MTQLKNIFIEVLLEMQMPKDDGTDEFKLFKHWCNGQITDISKTPPWTRRKRQSKTSKTSNYYCYIEFEYGDSEWMKLNPEHFNCFRLNGWRLDMDYEENQKFLKNSSS